MAQGRNWLKTTWPASFRGVPFEVERDDEEGGRRIVQHEFPMRDMPFNEDLGEAKREYDVTAYVAADDVEDRAAALIAACAARGPATLVLPMHGSLTARCLTFKRNREKDKTGKIAFALKLIREGAPSSLISFNLLSNMIFVGADSLQGAVVSFAAATILNVGQPDFVIQAATDGLSDGAAMLEAIRSTSPIDTIVSADQRRAIQAVFDAAPAAVSGSSIDATQFGNLVIVARALSDGMDGGAAVAAFEPMIETATIAEPTQFATASAKAEGRNRIATYLMIRLAALAAYAEGIARADIPDRQTAITLRANAAEYFDGAMNAMSADDGALYLAASTLRGNVVEYLSRAILDRAPIIQAGSNMSMPSLWWSHRLYQDPARAAELVERNSVQHPSFMPLDFEALAR